MSCELLHCPHCEQALVEIELPAEAGWDSPTHLACFNDDCPYFERGWHWMRERFAVNASYRYRVDPLSGQASPLAVWSRDALRDRIVLERDRPEAAETAESEC